MSEKICRLCLQTISTNNCQTIGESLLKTLKLNLKISKESVMCFECASRLEVFSKFTPGRVYVGDGTLPLSNLQNDVKLEPVKIEATSNLQLLMKTETKCGFCTETYRGEDLVSLNESKEHKFLVNMLEQYISDTILENAGELLTCGTCLEALQGGFSIILKCLEVEEKISEYIELKGTDDEGQVELKDVQQFMLRPPELETEWVDVNELEGRYDRIKEENSTMAQVEIKYENEISHPQLIIKSEDADIKSERTDCDVTVSKSEQSDCDGFQEPFIEYQVPNDPLHIPVVTSDMRKCKEHIKQHHKNPSEVNLFQCVLCSYETKFKSRLKNHLLTHKNPSEVKMFKCDLCSYETIYNGHLKSHLLTHKTSSEIDMFRCELCSYEAKRKSDLKRHLLTHKSSSEIKMFKCELCSYETKYKYSLKIHVLTHINTSELNMFKCELCSYETRQKSTLSRHLLIHKSPSEIKKFKCELCSYEAKQKVQLTQHSLTHKGPSELEMFRCELCSFATKYKYGLKMHLVTHKNTSELKMFKCELCSYEGKQKAHLTQHLLTHKRPSELEMFRCELCSYATKYKHGLKMHLLTHKNTSEVKMFKCELCSYEGKQKAHLTQHLLTHKTPAEIEMFKCASCSYEARRKSALKRHVLTH